MTVRRVGPAWLHRAAGALGLRTDDHAVAMTLHGSKYDDAAVEFLVELRDLEQLTLANTRVSAAGIERLRRALPGCRVERR